ncbi:hypothetical protein NBH19_09630 [Rhizobium sp. S95]|uniref:Inner membrane protein n=1 Tax=Ciceribacter sichuanensis TaxID=2949647 RepID=A0AAJ1BWK2_9HYPH|nr:MULTISPECIES: hypothetical protein [unclassified Ciceribacter]MCM2396338.1 hypothetical protein [Ciceribacter sp. S95]MCO5957511.1 hypothetical protein [Ciceribacter sp. S101]
MVSGKPPRRSKSPQDPVTIDLTAEEAKPAEAEATQQAGSAEISADASMPRADTSPIDAPLQDAETATTAEEPSPTESVEAKPETDVFSETGTASEQAATEPSPSDPTPRQSAPAPRPAPATSSLVAAGILGGLIALIAAGSMQYAGFLPAASPATSSDSDTSALSSEVEALRSQIATLSAAGPVTTDPALANRLAALEASVASRPEATVDPAAVEELRLKLAQNEEALATLRNAVAGNSQALSDSERRLAEAEKKIEEPRTDVQMARAIAVTALKSAIDRGGPYLAELDALASIAPDDPAVEGLRPHAATGVQSRADLIRRFSQTADAALAAIHQPDPNEGIGQRLLSSALSVVKVRPVGNVEGSTPEAIIARMEDKLQNGDLKGASLEWDTLPDAAKAASSGFNDLLKTRIDVEALIGAAMAAAVAGTPG